MLQREILCCSALGHSGSGCLGDELSCSHDAKSIVRGKSRPKGKKTSVNSGADSRRRVQ